MDAINRARSIGPEEIWKALASANVPADQLLMPWIGVQFDEMLLQIQKGTYATIYPFDLAAADVTYPPPATRRKSRPVPVARAPGPPGHVPDGIDAQRMFALG